MSQWARWRLKLPEIVYSTVFSGADQWKHQSSASLAFVRGNSSVTGEFPAQRTSNAENVSMLMTSSWYISRYATVRDLGRSTTRLLPCSWRLRPLMAIMLYDLKDPAACAWDKLRLCVGHECPRLHVSLTPSLDIGRSSAGNGSFRA